MFEGIQMLINHFGFIFFFLLWHTLCNSVFKPKKNDSVKWSVYICMHCIAGVFCFQAFYCLFGCECFKQRNETHFTKHSDTNTKTFYSVCAGDAVRINDGSRESSVFLRRSLSLSLFTLLKILDDSDACVQCVCVHLEKLALRWMVHHVLYCVRQCFISMVLTAIHSLCLALSLSLHSSKSIHSSLTPGKSYEFEREMILKWKPQHHLLNNFECYVLKHRHLASVIEITMLKLAAHKPSC